VTPELKASLSLALDECFQSLKANLSAILSQYPATGLNLEVWISDGTTRPQLFEWPGTAIMTAYTSPHVIDSVSKLPPYLQQVYALGESGYPGLGPTTVSNMIRDLANSSPPSTELKA
jgi:hypothetical protein